MTDTPCFLLPFRARVRVLRRICSVAKALVHSGLTAATLSSVSRRYGLSNLQAGALLAAYDLAAALFGFVISLAVAAAAKREAGRERGGDLRSRRAALGQENVRRGCCRRLGFMLRHSCARTCLGFFARKELVLVAGLAVFAAGSFMYGAPQLAHGAYEVPPLEAHVCAINVNASDVNATSTAADAGIQCNGDAHTSGHSLLGLLVVAQIVLGVGAAPLYTVGPALIDEVWESSASSSRALGFFFASAAVGPAVGFVLGGLTLSRWVEGEAARPPGIQPDSRFWVGRWYAGFWLGAILAAALLPLFACALLLGRKARRQREVELRYLDLEEEAENDDEEGGPFDGNSHNDGEDANGDTNGGGASDSGDLDGDDEALAGSRSRNGSGNGGAAQLVVEREAGNSSREVEEREASEISCPASAVAAQDCSQRPSGPGLFSLTFVALIAALTFEVFGKSAIVPFVPMVVQEIFGVSASTAAYTVGAVLVPAAIFGTVAGGVLVMWTKMSTRSQILYCAATTFMGACIFVGASFTMVACDQLAFAGVNAPAASQSASGKKIPAWLRELFHNHSAGGDQRFSHDCNLGCGCSVEYQPVCSSTDGLTYLNGCLAGCGEADVNGEGVPLSYTNCTCAPSDGRDSVAPGECARACDALYGFLALLFVAIFCTFLNASPVMGILMECAGSPEKRALSLAVGALAYRLFGAIPGPIAEGWLLDRACSYESPCTDACIVHDPHGVRVAITALPLPAMGLSAGFYVVAWLLYGRKSKTEGARVVSWRPRFGRRLRRLFSRRPWRAFARVGENYANGQSEQWEQLEDAMDGAAEDASDDEYGMQKRDTHVDGAGPSFE